MANTLGDMVVRIRGDNTDFDRSIDDSKSKLQTFGESATRIGRGLTTGLTLPIVGIGVAFVKAASDAQETDGKFNAVFRSQSDAVRAWAGEFSEAVGRSTTENLSFLATIQDTLVPLGLQREAASEMSKATVELATDLASFNNLPTSQVIADIQSGLVGNTETLRKYGVVANQAEIIQEALNLGLIETASELDATSKAQAIYSILVKGTTDAQGDALRTADSTANQFRALKAEVIDLAISFGNELLPTVNNMVDGARNLVEWFTNLDDGTKRIILTMGGVAAAVGPVTLAIGGLSRAMAVLTANPIILGLTAIAAGVVILSEKIASARSDLRDYNALIHDTSAAILGLDLAQQQQRRNQLAADALNAQTEQLTVLREITNLNRERAETEAEFAEIQNMTTQEQEFANRALAAYDADIRSLQETLQVYVDRENELNNALVILDESLEDARQSTIDVRTEVVITTETVEEETTAFEGATTAIVDYNQAIEETGAFVGAANVAARVANELLRLEREERARLTAERIAGMEEVSALEDQSNITSTAGFVAAVNARRAALAAEMRETQIALGNGTKSWLDYASNSATAWRDAYAQIRADSNATADVQRNNLAGNETAIISSVQRTLNVIGDAKKKDAEFTKKIAAFNVILDTASAVIRFLANPGGVAGIALSVGAGITGLAQLAAIQSQPVPALAAGGIVTGPTPALVGEGGQPEVIFPLDQLGDFIAQRNDFDDVGGTGGQIHLVVEMDSKPVLDKIFEATRNRTVRIDARAVV